MLPPLFISSFNDQKNLYAVFEENENNAWLYLGNALNGNSSGEDIIADVFICNTLHLIDHTELERYKPGLPPITKTFGHPEAVCTNINDVHWKLIWLGNNAVVLTKDQKPWALLSSDDKRGMCKAIKKSGPWGNNWSENKYKSYLSKQIVNQK